MSRRIKASTGAVWSIHRRWLPKVRWRGPVGKSLLKMIDPGMALDFADSIGSLVSSVLVAIALIAGLFLFIYFGLPLIILLGELAVLIVVGALEPVRHFLLKTPWTVIAATKTQRHEWQVVGWRGSGELIAEVARHLEGSGVVPRYLTTEKDAG